MACAHGETIAWSPDAPKVRNSAVSPAPVSWRPGQGSVSAILGVFAVIPCYAMRDRANGATIWERQALKPLRCKGFLAEVSQNSLCKEQGIHLRISGNFPAQNREAELPEQRIRRRRFTHKIGRADHPSRGERPWSWSLARSDLATGVLRARRV